RRRQAARAATNFGHFKPRSGSRMLDVFAGWASAHHWPRSMQKIALFCSLPYETAARFGTPGEKRRTKSAANNIECASAHHSPLDERTRCAEPHPVRSRLVSDRAHARNGPGGELRPARADRVANAGGVDAGFGKQLFAARMLEEAVGQAEVQQR